jgi:hypothetical protein
MDLPALSEGRSRFIADHDHTNPSEPSLNDDMTREQMLRMLAFIKPEGEMDFEKDRFGRGKDASSVHQRTGTALSR